MMEQAWRDQFQADWWSSEPASWVPGLPVSTEMSCFQTLAPPGSSSTGGQQLVEYHYESPVHVFEKSVRHSSGIDIDMVEMKIHMYPERMLALGERYTVPLSVAIGPYHHDLGRLKTAEKLKHLAAYRCIETSGRSVQEVYDAVVSVAHVARSLYHEEAVAGIVDGDFYHMMFFDACFLVQYMVWCTVIANDGDKDKMEPRLLSYFNSNQRDIENDILLLENQLPWVVLNTVVSVVSPGLVNEFIVIIRTRVQTDEDLGIGGQHFEWDTNDYKPPHLLGLYRFYMVKGSGEYVPSSTDKLPKEVPISVSAIDLAEMAMKMKPSKTEGYMDLSIDRGPIHGKLCLPPMFLDETAAARLVSMAAFELCTNPDFFASGDDDAYFQDSAVCSYLLLLAMFVEREEDVQELRTRNLLRRGVGVGLTNKEALHFFTTLGKHLREGPCYWDVMIQISQYKNERWVWVRVHKFFFRHRANIITACTAIAGFIGLFGTLMSLKKG